MMTLNTEKPALTWDNSPGYYVSSWGHVISSIGRRWFITWPGEYTPDVERASLRDAKRYVEEIYPGDRVEPLDI